MGRSFRCLVLSGVWDTRSTYPKVVYIALANGENDLPFDNGMDVSMDSTSSLSSSTSKSDADNDSKSSNDEEEDYGVGMSEGNINTSKSGIPNSGASDIGT